MGSDRPPPSPLFSTLLVAVGAVAAEISATVLKLYTQDSPSSYELRVQELAEHALTIVESVPSENDCRDEASVLSTDLLRALCREVRTHVLVAIEEVRKLQKNGLRIMGVSSKARTLVECARHVAGIADFLRTNDVPPTLLEMLHLTCTIQMMADDAISHALKGSSTSQFGKTMHRIQVKLATCFNALPAEAGADADETIRDGHPHMEFLCRQDDVNRYLGLLLKEINGQKDSQIALGLVKSTKATFYSDCIMSMATAFQRHCQYSLENTLEPTVDADAAPPKPRTHRRSSSTSSAIEYASSLAEMEKKDDVPGPSLSSETIVPTADSSEEEEEERAARSSSKSRKGKKGRRSLSRSKSKTKLKMEQHRPKKTSSVSSTSKNPSSSSVRGSSVGSAMRLGQKSLNPDELVGLQAVLDKVATKQGSKSATNSPVVTPELSPVLGASSSPNTPVKPSKKNRKLYDSVGRASSRSESPRPDVLYGDLLLGTSKRSKRKASAISTRSTSDTPSLPQQRKKKSDEGKVTVFIQSEATTTAEHDLLDLVVQTFMNELPWFKERWLLDGIKAPPASTSSSASFSLAEMLSESQEDVAKGKQLFVVATAKMALAKELTARYPSDVRTEAAAKINFKRTFMSSDAEKKLRKIAMRKKSATNSSLSNSSLFSNLEVPRLRSIGQSLSASVGKFVTGIFSYAEGCIEEAELSERCHDLYEHLGRMASICTEGSNKAAIVNFLDGVSVRERIEEAPVSGTVDPEFRKRLTNSRHAAARSRQLRLAMYNRGSGLRSIVAQSCSTINSVGEEGKVSAGIVLQLVTHILNFLDNTKELLDLAETSKDAQESGSATTCASGSTESEDSSPEEGEADAIDFGSMCSEPNIWEDPGVPAEVLAEYPDWELGSLNGLVMRLTSDTQHDVEFMKTFIATYPSFMTPEVLFSKLMERYEVPESKKDIADKIRLRICIVMKYWLSHQFSALDESLILAIKNFILQQLVEDKLEHLSSMLASTLQTQQEERDHLVQQIYVRTLPSLKSFEMTTAVPAQILLTAKPMDLALHMCYHDYSIFKLISTEEFLNQGWNKKFKSPNIEELIRRVNQISYWVASAILWHKTPGKRAKVLTKFADLAMALRELNNFNSLMAILGGLQMACISRLKLTAASVKEKTTEQLKKLQEVMDPGRSFLNYRNVLKTSTVPCIPYLGTHLKDLTFVDDGNDDMVGAYVNFGKYRMTYQTIQVISMFQEQGYALEPEEPMMTFTQDLPHLDEESLWNLSQKREPRASISTSS